MMNFPVFFARYPIEFVYEEGGSKQVEETREEDKREKPKTKAETIIEYLKNNRERDILTGHTHI